MANKTIAIVSNNSLFPQLFDTLLYRKINGVKIIKCKSIEDIENKIPANSSNLVIVDSAVNGLPSLEVIRNLRMERKVVTPIYFFSDIQTEAYRYKAYEMGINKIIYKPFDPDCVTDEIAQLLNGN